MITRKIGSLLRGKSTPFQVSAACMLASWIAFVPGFAQGPGWLATLVAGLLVLNANLGLALLVLAPARIASLALVPTSFEIGRFLLDGPARGVFAAAAASPGLAWFGLEHYVTVGGMVLGLGFGVVCAFAVNKALSSFRRKMSAVENDSQRYQELVAKPWIKVLCFVFVGGKRKKSYEDLAQKRFGNPIRVAGIAVVALAAAAGFALRGLIASPLVTEALHTELVRANGATVDLERVELDLSVGRMTIASLAIADPADLGTDLFRADTLEADLDVGALLRRRFTIERLLVREARHGAPRTTPGVLTAPAPVRPETPETTDPQGASRTIDDYIEDAKVWKERLARVRGHIERIFPSEGADEMDPATSDERLEERVRALGHAGVVSEGLVTRAPALTVSELVVEGLRIEGLAGQVFDVDARNLSTHPARLAEPTSIEARSRSGNIELALDGGAPDGEGLRFRARDLPMDGFANSIRVNGEPVIEGGRIDLSLVGGWTDGQVGFLDLPLEVYVRGTSILVPGHGMQPIEELQLAIGLRGPLDAPRVLVDTQELRATLIDAGKARLRAEADQVLVDARAEAERLKAEATQEAERLAQEALAEAERVAREQEENLRAKAKEEARKAAGKELSGRLGGLLSRSRPDADGDRED